MTDKTPALIMSTDTLTGEQQTETLMLTAFTGEALRDAFNALDEFHAGLEPGLGAGFDLLAWHANDTGIAAFILRGKGCCEMLIAGCAYLGESHGT